MGSGLYYMPQFSASRPMRVSLTSPRRKTSVYDLLGDAKTKKDMAKPRLLNHVVREEEMKDIVSRLTRPTMATRMRAVNFRPQSQYTYVDMGRYQWSKMALYADYQHHIYTSLGAVRPDFNKTVKASCYRPRY